MEPSVLFHSKLWMLNWWTNWIFCLISHNGIFIKSYLSAWIPGGFVWIFDLYEFQYGYEFKSCPFKVRCQIESFVTYLTMEFCLQFLSKLLATQVSSFQIQMSNWSFCCISKNEILLALSFKAMNFLKEFKFSFQI